MVGLCIGYIFGKRIVSISLVIVLCMHYSHSQVSLSDLNPIEEMSWEYKSKEAAFSFSQKERPLSVEIIIRILNFLRLKKNMPSIEKLEEFGCEFDCLLDVGCGSGARIGAFTPYFKSTIGIDQSESLIKIARENNFSKEITYFVGCGEDIPVPDESVDLATFVFSAFYMDINKVELELKRVLKPNGVAVFYGYLVDGIDFLRKESCNEVVFPELTKKALDLWKKCFKNFVDYANETNHPERHNFNKFEELYKDLKILDKTRIDEETYSCMNLEGLLRAYEQAIPFYKNAMKEMNFNPIKKFRQDVKSLWQILDLDDEDISIKITKSSYIIFLTK